MESVLLYVLGIVIVLVGLIVSIGLHEVGHLVPAKLFGVRVTQYMIGFGRTVWSRRKGETEYGLKLIPLGGYISMIGMFPPTKAGGKARNASTGFFDTLVQDARDASADTIGAGDEDRTFFGLPVWKRIIIMLGGPFMNLVLAVVFIGIAIVGFGVAQPSNTLATVSACVLPATSDRQSCEAGDPVSPAAAAGLKPGDTILSMDGTAVTTFAEFSDIVQASPGEKIELVIDRGGKKQTLTLTPLLLERAVLDAKFQPVKDASGAVKTHDVGFAGVTPQGKLYQQPVTEVLPTVGNNITSVAGIILNLPQRLVAVAQAAFGSGERDPNGPISVVGVGRIAGEVVSLDEIPVASKAATMFGILGSLNVALFVFNLVPLLPLDGGHVAAALWEAIRRGFAKAFKRKDPGPVDAAKLVPLTFAVVAVLGAMSVLLIYADIVKPISVFN